MMTRIVQPFTLASSAALRFWVGVFLVVGFFMARLRVRVGDLATCSRHASELRRKIGDLEPRDRAHSAHHAKVAWPTRATLAQREIART